jgi:hypothetical protein
MGRDRAAAAATSVVLAVAAAGCALLAGLGDDYTDPGDAAPDVEDHATDGATLDSETPRPDVGAPETARPGDAMQVEAGPAGCANAGYIFCDDFEGALDQWTPQTSNGTVTIDPSFACSGMQSLHVTANVPSPNNGGNYTVGLVHNASLPSDVFVRVFARVTRRPTPDMAFLLIYAGATGVQEEINSGVFGGQNYGFGTHKIWGGPSARLGPCECVEMEINQSTGHVKVWINDQNMVDTGYGSIPSFDTIKIGPSVLASSGSIAEDMWLDDFAYDGKRIGCTK